MKITLQELKEYSQDENIEKYIQTAFMNAIAHAGTHEDLKVGEFQAPITTHVHTEPITFMVYGEIRTIIDASKSFSSLAKEVEIIHQNPLVIYRAEIFTDGEPMPENGYFTNFILANKFVEEIEAHADLISEDERAKITWTITPLYLCNNQEFQAEVVEKIKEENAKLKAEQL